MFTVLHLLIVFLCLKSSIEWSCPSGIIDVDTEESGQFPNVTDEFKLNDHYPSSGSCLLNFNALVGSFITINLNFQPSWGDVLTIRDNYGLNYAISGITVAEFAANFSFYLEPTRNSTGSLVVSWTTLAFSEVTIDSSDPIEIKPGSFQTFEISVQCDSSVIAQPFTAKEPIILIFPNYTYNLETSKTFFYHGEAINGTYLGGIYNNLPNLAIDTPPYVVTAVTDCSKGNPSYLDLASVLITQLHNVQRYSEYLFYLDVQRPLSLLATGRTPSAVVIGCPLLMINAELSQYAYVEWYVGVAQPGDVPISSFSRANTSMVSSGIYVPEGGNTMVLYNGTVIFDIDKEASFDHMTISGGLTIVVTPYYGQSDALHPYNWSFVAHNYYYYDITVTSVECDEHSFFNFIYFNRPVQLNRGDTLRMLHLSNFVLEFVPFDFSSTGGKLTFNATLSALFNPQWGPPITGGYFAHVENLPLLLITVLLFSLLR